MPAVLNNRIWSVALVALLPASAAATSYRAGHHPGWVGPSIAERLIRAEAVLLVLAAGERLRVEEVLSGPSSLLGTELEDRRIVGVPRGPIFSSGQRYVVVASMKPPGGWELDGLDGPFYAPVADADSPVARAARKVLDLRSEHKPLTEALQEAIRRADPETATILQKLWMDHRAAASPYKTASELRQLYESAPDDETRARALDAMGYGKHEEALPIARAILKARSNPDLMPAAIHAVAALRDRSSIPLLIDAYSTLGAGASLSAHRTGRSRGRMLVIDALTCIGTAADAPSILQLLRKASDEEAATLANVFFTRYPNPHAVEGLREKVNGMYAHRPELAYALAVLGDAAVARWAQATLESGEEIEIVGPPHLHNAGGVALGVIARSPLREARDLREKLLAAAEWAETIRQQQEIQTAWETPRPP